MTQRNPYEEWKRTSSESEELTEEDTGYAVCYVIWDDFGRLDSLRNSHDPTNETPPNADVKTNTNPSKYQQRPKQLSHLFSPLEL
jgi:hypothetical protein